MEFVSSSIALLNSSSAFSIHCGKMSMVGFQAPFSCCMVKKIRLPLSSGTFTLNWLPEGLVRVKLNSLFLSPALIILEKWMLIFTLIAIKNQVFFLRAIIVQNLLSPMLIPTILETIFKPVFCRCVISKSLPGTTVPGSWS